ncbi:MAG: molybdenum ABC transporter ATP-binding protein [Tahibacter sp.]
MTLSVDIEHRAGEFLLQAEFAAPGGVTALFGRSGSGKTTLVNLIAGLLRPKRARIVLDGEILVDTSQGIELPAHRRRIGYVFQDARLFPHLSVRGNLLYGRRFRPATRHGVSVDDIVALLGLGDLLQRQPQTLSGGEQQRVAIGRALLASPRLLLLDEPLASLDAPRRAEILPYIERLRDQLQLSMIYVSHSVAEVARLSNHLIVLEKGRIIADGATAPVLARSDLAIEADDAGAVLRATVVEHDAAFALTRLRAAGGYLYVPLCTLAPGSRAHLHVRARDVMLATRALNDVSAQNILDGTVSAMRERGAHAVEVRVTCGDDTILASITRRAADRLGLTEGMRVYAIIKSVAIDSAGLGPEATNRQGVQES